MFALLPLFDPCLGLDKSLQTRNYGGLPPDPRQLGKKGKNKKPNLKQNKDNNQKLSSFMVPGGVSHFLKRCHPVFLGPEAVRESEILFPQQKQRLILLGFVDCPLHMTVQVP